MATYGYGPPPPPPGGAPPQAYQPQYGQYQQPTAAGHSHSGHVGRGGRGGHAGRGDFHGAVPPSYPYNNQPQPPSYAGPHHTPPPPHAPLAPQNYHPNYAPQLYQQPQYAHQQPYPHQQPQQPPQPPQQPSYAHHYPPYAQPPSAPPHQPWGGHAATGHQPAGAATHFGSGRGRGGHQGDRGGHKAAAAMGPPLRMGFDNRGPEPPALVSSASVYPAQPFGPPQGATPYAPQPPYHPGYPQPGPPQMHTPGPPHFDPYQPGQHGSGRPHGRGGFHNSNNSNNNRGRPHTGGDKMRQNGHKKPSGAPTTPHNGHQKPDAPSAGKKKKRKTNTLGLTPGDESDDDLNEEAKLVELIGADAPNPADIDAWIAERKANFPTQARAKTMAAAAAAGSGDKIKDVKDAAASSLEKQKLKAEKLRKQLEKVESSIKRKREQQDEGDDMRDVKASPSSSDDSQSDSEKPEVLPSRPAVPPPSKKADPSKHCKYYSTGGVCGKKGKCRFVHDEAVRSAALREREMNGGRMTLQQRLTLNDKDQEDLTIVKTLQYLKEKGLIDQSGSAPSSQLARSETSADLPPRPAVVATPSRASADPYQGWDLNGFGSSGARDSV